MNTELNSATLEHIVTRIVAGDTSGSSDLYALLQQGVRFYIARRVRVRANIEDLVHDVFVGAVEGIRRGALHNPERLVGYILGIARHVTCDSLSDTIASRLPGRPLNTTPLRLILLNGSTSARSDAAFS